MTECMAGRTAFCGGSILWQNPCMRSMEPTHVITDHTVKNAPVIELCEFHYNDALAQGLVTMPNPSEEVLEEARRFRPEIFKAD